MLKHCPGCQTPKPEEEFHFKSKVKGTRQSRCKPCQRKAQRESYRRSPGPAKERSRKRRKRLKEEHRRYLRELRSSTPCMDCKQKYHWVAMQFDHVRGTKVANIADLVSAGRDRSTLLRELQKCELVCANCHAVRTYTRLQMEREKDNDMG